MSNWHQPDHSTPGVAGAAAEETPTPHALTDDERETFNRLLAFVGLASMAHVLDMPEPDQRVALMRVWLDGEPRAVLALTFHEEGDPEDLQTVTPIALILADGDFERLSPEPPGE